MRADVYVQQTHLLPMRVRAMTVDNPDGTYTVLVNADLADDVKEKACRHEFEHIENMDFESPLDADSIEARAHKRR